MKEFCVHSGQLSQFTAAESANTMVAEVERTSLRR